MPKCVSLHHEMQVPHASECNLGDKVNIACISLLKFYCKLNARLTGRFPAYRKPVSRYLASF